MLLHKVARRIEEYDRIFERVENKRRSEPENTEANSDQSKAPLFASHYFKPISEPQLDPIPKSRAKPNIIRRVRAL
jgi:hypothetical protein